MKQNKIKPKIEYIYPNKDISLLTASKSNLKMILKRIKEGQIQFVGQYRDFRRDKIINSIETILK